MVGGIAPVWKPKGTGTGRQNGRGTVTSAAVFQTPRGYLSDLSNQGSKLRTSPVTSGFSQILQQKTLDGATTDTYPENKHKSVFVDSSFYSPQEHPTLQEKVALASQISSSLSDVTNRKSRGQSMYEKRKERSPKWIHQDGPLEPEDYLPPVVTPKNKPLLKLVMSGRGQELDLEALQAQGLVIADQEGFSPEICSDIVKDLHASNGKGGQIFAKRKKRSEKWVVDDLHPEPRRPGERPTTQLSVTSSPRQQLTTHIPVLTSPEQEVPTVRLSQLITSPQAPKFPTDGVYSPRLAQGWVPQFPTSVETAEGTLSDTAGAADDTAGTVADSVLLLEPTPRCVLSDSIEESLRLMNEKRHQRANEANYNTAARGWGGVLGYYYTPLTFGSNELP